VVFVVFVVIFRLAARARRVGSTTERITRRLRQEQKACKVEAAATFELMQGAPLRGAVHWRAVQARPATINSTNRLGEMQNERVEYSRIPLSGGGL